MKKVALPLLVVLFSCSLYATEYIVKLKNAGLTIQSVASTASLKGFAVKDFHRPGKLAKVDIQAATKQLEAKQVDALRKRPGVEYVVENIKFHTLEVPNDPQFNQQWALSKINAPQAWDVTQGSNKVVVAVIDTGSSVTHEDLAANIWTNPTDGTHGWNFVENNSDVTDLTSADGNPGHGTHCSGIIGAVGNNGIGITGINQSVSIMPVRFLGPDGSGDLLNAAKAIDFAVQNGASIISASWGAQTDAASAQPVTDAISRANDKGVLFVAAASNDSSDNDTTDVFPANTKLPNMISVAASDANDAKPDWSNWGKHTVHLAAPGDNILSTLPNNQYGDLSGTSMATPLVAGLAALMKSENAALTPQQIRSILQTTGTAVQIESACNCRVDASAAVNAVAHQQLTVVPASASINVGDVLKFDAFGGQAPYTFASSDNTIATVASDGTLQVAKGGEITVTATDANGQTAQSRTIYITDASAPATPPTPPTDPVTPPPTDPVAPPVLPTPPTDPVTPPGGAQCPIADPSLCATLCQFEPTLPWCTGSQVSVPAHK